MLPADLSEDDESMSGSLINLNIINILGFISRDYPTTKGTVKILPPKLLFPLHSHRFKMKICVGAKSVCLAEKTTY